jgi:hypothetical protein
MPEAERISLLTPAATESGSPRRLASFSSWCLGLALFLFGQPAPSAEVREVQLQGRLVCLAEEMHRLHRAELPSKHEHVYGLKTTDGKCYTILHGAYSEALFADARLREKELLLKARLFPGSQIIEVTRTRSVRNGVIHDLYYYCTVCAIRSASPDICACCQEPVELVETPE